MVRIKGAVFELNDCVVSILNALRSYLSSIEFR